MEETNHPSGEGRELGGAKPRHRFCEKADRAGFDKFTSMQHADLVRLTRETLALVWPDKAYPFEQVIVLERQVEVVAREMGVDERTVRRRLAGHKNDLGAEDWFLIILEMYREADCAGRGGAELLQNCLLAAVTDTLGLGSFHRTFFLLMLECLANADIAAVTASLPWVDAGPDPVLAWPCYPVPAPLENSLLPGFLAALRSAGNMGDASMLCLLGVMLARDQRNPVLWKNLLGVLNMGGAREVAKLGQIPAAQSPAAQDAAELLLHVVKGEALWSVLAVLACTKLSWETLCNAAGQPELSRLAKAVRVRQCFQRYLDST